MARPHKNGNKETPLIYRPIILTSLVNKLIEKQLKEQRVDPLEKLMLRNMQFAFTEGRLCKSEIQQQEMCMSVT